LSSEPFSVQFYGCITDISQIAAFLAPLLPYLVKGGIEMGKAAAGKLGEKITEESWDGLKALGKQIRRKGGKKPALQEALADADASPTNEDTREILRLQLKKLLAEDSALLKEAGTVVGQIVNMPYSERNVVGQDFTDSPVFTGDGNRYVKAEIYIEGNAYSGPPPRNPQEALSIYRRVVAQMNSSLPLRGVDLGASDPTAAQKPIGLANVYVDLDTTTQAEIEEKGKKERRLTIPGEERAKPLSALEAVIHNHRLALKGDPGGGKSTFVNYLAYCLASQKAANLKGWPKTESDILPLSVILRDFARSLPKTLPQRADPCHLWNFIAARLKAQNLTSASKPIQELLEQGKVFVLLDGLDEVPTIAQRVFVRDSVKAFIERYPDNRFLVTCRILSYQPPKSKGEPDLRLAAFPEFELAKFDPEKISAFIKHWYEELAGLGIVANEESPRLTQRLQAAIQRPELRRLAPNPLLLTVMALVHTHKGRLPDARALLYEDTIDILLWRWEQVSKGQASLSKLMLEAGCTDIDLKRVLQELAYQAHTQVNADDDGEKLAGISESNLEKTLACLNKSDRNWAAQVIETMKMRAGLLLERDMGIFTFPHRSFQEYLAGAYLTSQADFITRAIALAEGGNIWREVILWAVGCFVYLPGGNIHMPLALAAELCSSASPKNNLDWLKTWLAGDIVLEIGLNRVEAASVGHDLLPRVRERLSNLLIEGALTPRERASAGDTLARLGDPRPGVSPLLSGEGPGVRSMSLLLCEIPAGKFPMGSKKGEPDSYDDEYTQFTCEIEMPFYLARYPVTNAQFEAFVNDPEGYQKKEWWTAAGWDWRKSEKRTQPPKDGGVFDLPNHPVVNVSWYEAHAFTRWLTRRFQVSGFELLVYDPKTRQTHKDDNLKSQIVNRKLEIRLPSEAEWEKAARSTDGRKYPWGEKITPDHANYDETGIGATSAVGCFPKGESPYGLLDMSGNVWEWCATQWTGNYEGYKENNQPEGSDRRVVRGGAFYFDGSGARCAYRGRNLPDDGLRNQGFRVVVSPVF
jgi:formylglycine-generating enzyme required for sulfatase activity